MSARWNIFKLSDKKEEEPFLFHITIWFSSSNRHSTHDTFVLERKVIGGEILCLSETHVKKHKKKK